MRSYVVSTVALILLLAAAGCTSPQSYQLPASPTVQASVATPPAAQAAASSEPFTLHVYSVDDGGRLPAAYTCTVSFTSPSVSWDNVPAGTRTLTLIMDDPDAPSGTYTHWIVYNIPPGRKSLPSGITAVKEIDGGGQQGTSSSGERGYAAACPPIGSSHRYVFTLYAVDYTMGLPTADREGIDTFLNGHWIEKATVTTTFSR